MMIMVKLKLAPLKISSQASWIAIQINGVPTDLAGVMQDVQFSANGDYREVIQNGDALVIDGTWTLAENDINITVDIDNDGGTRTWSIDAISSTSLTMIDANVPHVFEKEQQLVKLKATSNMKKGLQLHAFLTNFMVT